MVDPFTKGICLGMMAAANLFSEVTAKLKVYILEPGEGELTNNHVCMATDLESAKIEFLKQLPWLVGRETETNYYYAEPHEQLLRREIYFQHRKILEIPLGKIRDNFQLADLIT